MALARKQEMVDDVTGVDLLVDLVAIEPATASYHDLAQKFLILNFEKRRICLDDSWR